MTAVEIPVAGAESWGCALPTSRVDCSGHAAQVSPGERGGPGAAERATARWAGDESFCKAVEAEEVQYAAPPPQIRAAPSGSLNIWQLVH